MFRQEHPEDRLAKAAHAPTWIFLAAAKVAFGNDEDVGEIEAEDVVCLLASLIDQVSVQVTRVLTGRATLRGGSRFSRRCFRFRSRLERYRAFLRLWT